jgi:hypothetical protein
LGLDGVGYYVPCVDRGGVTWCDHLLHGETEEELIDAAIEHGRTHADLSREELVTPAFRAFLKNAMKPEPARS